MTEKQIDIFKAFLEEMIPIAEIIDALGLNLNSDMECPPREWITKFMPHTEHLIRLGNEQVVLIEVPDWLIEYLDEDKISTTQVICQEEQAILHAMQDIDSPLVCQAVDAYKTEQYCLATTGLSVFLEGLVAEHVGKSKSRSVKIGNHVKELIENYRNEHEVFNRSLSDVCLYATLRSALNVYSKDSNFSEEEPESLNRHWLAHGRSKKLYSKADCLKMMSMIVGVSHLV